MQVKSSSSQLYWMVSAEPRPLSIETSLPLRPRQHRAQETRNDNSAAAGKVIFLPAFRNLPPVFCVPMPEQDFYLAVKRFRPNPGSSFRVFVRTVLSQYGLNQYGLNQ